MKKVIEWVKYYLITRPHRKYVHKLFTERYNTLHGLIRVVINFDEQTSMANATIRYRELIIAELDNDEMDSASEMLKTLRRLNRHNNNI